MAEKEYIEREAIYDKLHDIGGCDATDDWSKGWDKAIDAAINIIKTIPTADVVPVHHGHWNVGYFHDRVCSCCLHPDNDLNEYAHDFCPNCGAKWTVIKMTETLCWSCSRAYPGHGCCWADKFEPVPDWCAGMKIQYGESKKIVSYHVYTCPLFLQDERKPRKF